MLEKRTIVILAIACMLLFITPAGFAAADDLNNTVTEIDDSDSMMAEDNDYYFDASKRDDGNGSSSNPYKYLTSERIHDQGTHYFNEGEYAFNATKQIKTSTFIGSGAEKTTIDLNGGKFIVNYRLTLINLTIRGGIFTNYGVLEGENTIFSQSHGQKEMNYESYCGGVIYNQMKGRIILENCTFIDNHADYGGAIYMNNGTAEIADSRFINNTASSCGGAIFCENVESITIRNTLFSNNDCIDGDGGAIYIRDCLLKAEGIEINSSDAMFGAAITSLNSTLTVNNSIFSKNRAKWHGGAIFQMYGNLRVFNCNFSKNDASKGIGIYSSRQDTLILNGNNLSDGEICADDTVNLQIGNTNYTLYRLTDEEGAIPSQYDMREYSLLTPVKDQKNSGNCWAFASLAALESCIKKIVGTDFDLSEENMKNLVAYYSKYGYDVETNAGGNSYMAIQYLASWLGPVNEIDDRYGDKSVLSPVIDSTMHVQNIIFLTSDEIKDAILKYGAVVAKIHYDKKYLNNCSYYYPLTYPGINHDITIIGWDDTYSRYNFRDTPAGDGAWIVQSSWGSQWADNGYAYVSYYDGMFLTSLDMPVAYTFVLNDTFRFDRNYQHDIIGKRSTIQNDSSEVWYKVRFTATGREVLSAVSTYFEKPANWTLSVYVNGELKAVKSDHLKAGYWTVNLDEFIQLNEGDEFEIIFRTIFEGSSVVPVCEGGCGIANDTSYISYDGENWRNLYDDSKTACIKAFTILNRFESLRLDVDYDGFNPVNVTATILDQFGNPAFGNVTFSMSGYECTVKLENGTASIILNFDKGPNIITARFENLTNSTSFEILKREIALNIETVRSGNDVLVKIAASEGINASLALYINSEEKPLNLTCGEAEYGMYNLKEGNYTIKAILVDYMYEGENSTEITVKNPSPSISANKNVVMYYGAKKTYSVKAWSDTGVAAGEGEIVKFTVKSHTYSVKVGKNGIASFKISLKSGTYKITAEYKKVKVSNKIKVKPTLITKNVKIKKGKIARFKVTLLNSKGKALKAKKIIIKFKGKKYTVKTNKKGKAALKIRKLKVGKYKIITKYKKLKNTNRIVVKK